jgi:peptidoglycan/LPS O-acetylase OafA/YrhL
VRFHTLDSWRGICALFVALMHLPALSHFYAEPFFRNSYLFVDFFFVLSGFVITFSYGDKIVDWPSAGNFMVRRIGRIWPLHMVMLFLFVVLEVVKYLMIGWYGGAHQAPFTGETSPEALLTNTLLIQAAGIHDVNTWNKVSWSISAEFIVYAGFALTTIVFRARTALVLALLAAISAVVLVDFSPNYMDTQQGFGVLRCLYGFAVGHLVYRLYRHTATAVDGGPRFGSLVETAALVLVAVFVSGAGRGPATMVAPLLFGAVVYVFASGEGTFTRLLSTRFFRRLGELSFSIYVIHLFGVEMLMKVANVLEKVTGWTVKAPRVPGGDQTEILILGGLWVMDAVTLAYLAIVVVISGSTYRLIEKPGQRFFNNSLPAPRGEAERGVKQGQCMKPQRS